MKVYLLAGLLAASAGVWGWIQHQAAQHAATRVQLAETRETAARQKVADLAQALAESGDTVARVQTDYVRLHRAIANHTQRLDEIRSESRAMFDAIRRAPDDGCLDRPLPERLRVVPEPAGDGAADRPRAGGMPTATADAGATS